MKLKLLFIKFSINFSHSLKSFSLGLTFILNKSLKNPVIPPFVLPIVPNAATNFPPFFSIASLGFFI